MNDPLANHGMKEVGMVDAIEKCPLKPAGRSSGDLMDRHDTGDAQGIQKGGCMVFVGSNPAKKEVLMLDVGDIRTDILGVGVHLLTEGTKTPLSRQKMT
jgi:hypothetical protein